MAEQVILPPKYYLDYFWFLLEFVQRLYGHILDESEQNFIKNFELLSEDAQCLFVRMSNRQGSFFRTQKLKYVEIDDINAALYELKYSQLIEDLSEEHAGYSEEILNLFTKDEWLKMAPATTFPLRTLKKPELVRFLLLEFGFENLVQGINEAEPVVKVCAEIEVMMFKFLFFGNRYADMTEFVVRDIGKVNFERFREDSYTAHFANRAEAEQKLMISLTNEAFSELKETAQPPEDIYHWFMNWNASIHSLSEVARPSYDRLVCKVAMYLERQKFANQALTVYQLTDQIPSRERRVRLLHKLGLIDEATALCQDIANTPQNADERFFVIDFQEKLNSTKKRPVKSVTKMLQEAESVKIPVEFRRKVEQGVVEYFLEKGHEAVHAENYPWRGLFGLVFWDIIYDTNVQAIHHPLQRAPSDFHKPDFFVKRENALKQRISELTDTSIFLNHIEKTFTEKFGTANVLVDWSEVLLLLVQVIVSHLTVNQLAEILIEMGRNLRENTHGFADLMVWSENGLELIEVKSPTDHLSAQQLHWLQFLENIGVKARVLRVEWDYSSSGSPL